MEAEIDWKKARALGHSEASLMQTLRRAKRWLLANPGHTKPPRHIAEAMSTLRPKKEGAQ